MFSKAEGRLENVYKVFIDDSGSKDYINPIPESLIILPLRIIKILRTIILFCAGTDQTGGCGKSIVINTLKKKFGTHHVGSKIRLARNPHQRKA